VETRVAILGLHSELHEQMGEEDLTERSDSHASAPAGCVHKLIMFYKYMEMAGDKEVKKEGLMRHSPNTTANRANQVFCVRRRGGKVRGPCRNPGKRECVRWANAFSGNEQRGKQEDTRPGAGTDDLAGDRRHDRARFHGLDGARARRHPGFSGQMSHKTRN
jgi:hypothetical protein